jgi:carboxyl-terminal processing protease
MTRTIFFIPLTTFTMPRLLFTILLLLFTSVSASAQRSSTDIARYVEAVRIAANESYFAAPAKVIRQAMDAINPGAGRQSLAFTAVNESCAAVLSDLLHFEAARSQRPLSSIVDASLRQLLPKLDRWSGYMSQAEWLQYNQSLNSSYSGVGMDLEKEDDGSITCWPHPASSADKSGIRSGAKLLAVDGVPVEGLSIYSVGALVRGPRNTRVNLSVGSMGFMKKNVSVYRLPTQASTVFPSGYHDGRQILRISRFSSTTPQELAQQIQSGVGLELDLRGCRGGDLDAAADSAGLFIGSCSIAIIARKTGSETLNSRGPAKFANSYVQLLQDDDTASAAEMFIVALTSSGRGFSSHGGTTFGKATTQDIIPLKNGGAIVLTTGLISPYGGQTWHGRGVPSTN